MEMNQNCATSSISDESTKTAESSELELGSNRNQLTPISMAIQKSFYRTKLVINKAHSDYLNRIMEAEASLACELKSELKQMQKETTKEIKTTIQNEQRLLMEKLENAASPQSCYDLIAQHIATLKDIATLANKQDEQAEELKTNIVGKHKELIRSNQFKLQDLHTRFIVPLRNSVQCVATNQCLPNVGDTLQIDNGVFDEGYGNYQQYVLHEEGVGFNLSFVDHGEDVEHGNPKSDDGDKYIDCNNPNDRGNLDEDEGEHQSCEYDGVQDQLYEYDGDHCSDGVQNKGIEKNNLGQPKAKEPLANGAFIDAIYSLT